MGKNEYNNDTVRLLEYFYICGINEPRTNKLCSIKCLCPEVLYSSCAKEDRVILQEEEKELMTSKQLGMVFPQSNTFFSQLNIDNTNRNNFYTKPFEGHVKEIIFAHEIPEPSFHCFSQVYDSKDLYYNCLLYWRKIKYNNLDEFDELGEKKTKIIVREAFVILSFQPCFSFYNKLLTSIYNEYKESNKREEELSKLFEVLFLELKVDITRTNDITINPLFNSYNLYYKQFFPLCDLNIKKFFEIFSFEQFLFLLQLSLNRGDYVVVSNDYEFFYPLYFILKIFLHPLDNPDKTKNFHFSLFYGTTFIDNVENLDKLTEGQIAMFIYTSQVMIGEKMKEIVKLRAKIGKDKPLYLITIVNGKATIKELEAEEFIISERIEPYILFHKMIIENSNLLVIYNDIKKIVEMFSKENNNSFFSYDENQYKEIELFQYQMFNYMTNFFCHLKLEAKPIIKREEGKDNNHDINIDYKFNASLIREEHVEYIKNLLIYCLPDITHVTDEHVDNDSRLLMELLNLQKNKLLPLVLDFKPLLAKKNTIVIDCKRNQDNLINKKRVLKIEEQWLNNDYNIFKFLYEHKIISLEQEKEDKREVFLLGILYCFISSILIINNASLICPIQTLYMQMIRFLKQSHIYHGKITILLSCIYYIQHILNPSLKNVYNKTLTQQYRQELLDSVLLGIMVKNKENEEKKKNKEKQKNKLENKYNHYSIYTLKDTKGHEIYDYKTILFDKDNFIFKCPICNNELSIEVITNKTNIVLKMKKPSSFFDTLFNLLLSRSTLFFDVTNGEKLFTEEEYKDWINDYYLIMILSQESFPFFK